jgi:hypothetical protein
LDPRDAIAEKKFHALRAHGKTIGTGGLIGTRPGQLRQLNYEKALGDGHGVCEGKVTAAIERVRCATVLMTPPTFKTQSPCQWRSHKANLAKQNLDNLPL